MGKEVTCWANWLWERRHEGRRAHPRQDESARGPGWGCLDYRLAESGRQSSVGAPPPDTISRHDQWPSGTRDSPVRFEPPRCRRRVARRAPPPAPAGGAPPRPHARVTRDGGARDLGCAPSRRCERLGRDAGGRNRRLHDRQPEGRRDLGPEHLDRIGGARRDRAEIVRELYAVAAAAWVKAGRTNHHVLVP